MGRDYCTVPNCSNFPGKIGRFGIPVKLHRLPKTRTVRGNWLIAISRKNLKATTYTRVCSDHFTHGVGPSRHDPDKIPTLFLTQKKSNVTGKSRKQPALRILTAKPNNSDESIPDLKTTSESEYISTFHSYSQVNVSEDSDELPVVNSKDQASQTSHSVTDTGTDVVRPDITIEDIKGSNQDILFYTGLPDYTTFSALFNTFVQHGAADMCVTLDTGHSSNKTRKLRLIDEFVLVLMRLRLGLLVQDLSYRFKVSASTVSRIFTAWITFMNECLQQIVFLPSLDVLQNNIPECFQRFSDTRVILDCTEVFVQTPSSLENKTVTYSHYKSHNTFKCLVGVNMTGAVVFLSDLYGGSASDTEITRQSGLYELLNKGDAVMVDKGFIHIKPDLSKIGVKLYCPPFKTKIQFSKQEVELTRRIACARIHVERKMEQIKNFRILQGIVPLSISHIVNEIFHVCAALTNLLPPLAK